MSKKKILLKIIVLGESGVGKTSLLLRYVERKFTLNTKSTIGANFLTKEVEVDEKIATCQIWDTAGQERFQGLGTAFYRGSDGVIFVFDVTQRRTFEELEHWKEAFLIQVGQEGNKDFPMIIIANKIDLKEDRVVSRKELAEWCAQYGLKFFEASAKEDENVEKAFEEITRLVISRMKPEDIMYDTVDLSVGEKKEDKGCDC
jgi:Ras-related protein Rab-7A